LSGRGLCYELITRPEESYRLWYVVVYDLETSRIGAPYIYIYDISNLRVKRLFVSVTCMYVRLVTKVLNLSTPLSHSSELPIYFTIFLHPVYLLKIR